MFIPVFGFMSKLTHSYWGCGAILRTQEADTLWISDGIAFNRILLQGL